MAGKQALLRTALAVCVPVAGFVIGRGVKPPPATAVHEVAAPHVTSSRGGDAASLLCEISTGNLARARARISELRDASRSPDEDLELEKLLTAIAMKDGASFDAILASFPEDLRFHVADRCVLAIEDEPAAFVRLLADSEEFSRIALKARSIDTAQVIQREPGLFLDLLEQGQITWPEKTADWMARQLKGNSADSLRFLELCRDGQMKVSDESVLAGLMERLDREGLAKLQAASGGQRMSALLEQEEKARALFANFDPSGKSWEGILQRRMVTGMDDLIARSGVPDIDWGSVPPDLQELLPGSMVRTAVRSQGDAGARTLLDSIKNSDLPVETRNAMLERTASTLFGEQGNIRLAIDFAHAISDDADGHNAGEDLLIKWMAFDPVSAQDFTKKIEPSPYRDRILARVREISP